MAEKKVNKAQKAYDKFKRNNKEIDILMDTLDRSQRDVYDKIIDKHARNKKGEIDMNMWKEMSPEKVDEIYNDFVEEYHEIAIKEAKSNLEMDDIRAHMLTKMYTGVVREQLKGLIDQYGPDYSFETHYAHARQWKGRVMDELSEASYEALKGLDLKDLKKYLPKGADKHLHVDRLSKKAVLKLLPYGLKGEEFNRDSIPELAKQGALTDYEIIPYHKVKAKQEKEKAKKEMPDAA